jgi:hypothetical protein
MDALMVSMQDKWTRKPRETSEVSVHEYKLDRRLERLSLELPVWERIEMEWRKGEVPSVEGKST